MTSWKQIKKKNPKAFELFLKFMGYYENCKGNKTDPSPILYIQMQLILGNERILFDFFDEMGIIISIWLQPQTRSHLVWSVYNSGIFAHSSKYYGDRKEAETSAYKMAFKILEKQWKLSPKRKTTAV